MIAKDYTLGIDIGSTTVKIAILDPDLQLLFADYRRHHADIRGTLYELLSEAMEQLGDHTIHPVITGSGGLTLANYLKVPFVQEVVSVSTALEEIAPKTDVAIELGGEDAKIIYFENGNVEQRMNGICAGGTGSFIDQMASLLQTDAAGLNEYARDYTSLYTIAARCGVFAKSDIQPLINEGATKEDLAASIFQAVVNQTISGLACGKPIRGHVAFLGGPLHFLTELKEAFIRTLRLDEEHTIEVENSHLFAAMGSAMNAKEDNFLLLSEMKERLSGEIHMEFEIGRMDPLFESQEEYDAFTERHSKACVVKGNLSDYHGNCYLGIDAGSTTTKLAPWSVKTAPSCILSTAITREVPSRPPSVPLKRSRSSFPRTRASRAAAPPATVKPCSRRLSFWMKAKSRRSPTTMRQPSSIPTWTAFSTSADRT